MTSEVCLMNQQAIVLGADSAVTMSGGIRDGKIVESQHQTGVDKIFIINKDGPAAAMVSGSGSFGPVPWNTVFEQFEAYAGAGPREVPDYSAKIVEFLSDLQAKSKIVVGPDWETACFQTFADAFALEYTRFLGGEGWQRDGQLSAAVADAAIRRFNYLLDTWDMGTVPRGPRLEQFLDDHLGGALAKALGRQLAGTAFPEASIPGLATLFSRIVITNRIPPSLMRLTTQIVVAGYGKDVITPSMFSIRVLFAFGGIVKYQPYGKGEVTHDHGKAVHFSSFAQDHAVRAMIFGVTPQFERALQNEARDALSGIFQSLRNELSGMDKDKLALIEDYMEFIAVTFGSDVADLAKKAVAGDANSALRKILAQIGVANARNLTAIGGQLMNLVIAESKLAQNLGVAGPVRLLTMTRGHWEFSEIGEPS
ncbi:hypothetical protein [Asticcacaulis solisilvae]|uniref:hypothetical protein n=1 Tax=Asticcacaulis solisilvae TaxID=1217274 RepID=UPI003FD7C4EA